MSTDAPEQPVVLDRYECRSCGYVYEPTKGDNTAKIAPNTRFEDLSTGWRCPVCGARKTAFENIGPKDKPSGFQENLKYGLGVNILTPGQKNILIFGGLALAFLLMMSLYGLR
jgi:rubredoxin